MTIAELSDGYHFKTLLTGRTGRVLVNTEYSEGIWVEFSDGERRNLHRNVLVSKDFIH